jgi:alpha-glucosidase
MDATYKTKALKLPFVNFVGVNNVGCDDKTLSTFAIAGGWIATEDTTHYTWFLEQLANVVYMDGKWLPSLFVTNQSHPLITSINNVFPSSTHILCYIHLSRNLKTNTSRFFVSVEKWELAEKFFKKMCLPINQDGFDAFRDSLVMLAE